MNHRYSLGIVSTFLLTLAFCMPSEQKAEDHKQIRFSLEDFYTRNDALDEIVSSEFDKLDAGERISQMIITSSGRGGKPGSTVNRLIQKKIVGGVLLLGGDKGTITELVDQFDSLASVIGLPPFIFSSDAEPSLWNMKIKGVPKVPNTMDLGTKKATDSIASIISDELISMGIHHNFAPVVDLSPDNAAITNRTFGTDAATVQDLAMAFVEASSRKNIVTTAKHFPGHGLVRGDTHTQLVTIDGEMREVGMYKPFIENGILCIMVGHIAVVNNPDYQTGGLPSSCSRKIVTDLLKSEMGFQGIVVTDAMNMGALRKVDQASLKAVMAGCDMILMEPNEERLQQAILAKYQDDPSFKLQIDQSVKKILRLKACLNLFE